MIEQANRDRQESPMVAGLRAGLWLVALLLCTLLARCAPPPIGTSTPTPQPIAGVHDATPAQAPDTPAPPDATPTASASPTSSPTPTPTPTPTPQPWRFVVLGDTRTSGLKPPQVTYDLIAQASRTQPEVVLAGGELHRLVHLR